MIYGQKVYLRGVEEKDIPYRVKWLNDSKITKTLNFEHPVSELSTRSWLSRVVNDPARKDFTVCLQNDDRPIGYCGFLNIDWRSRKAEIYGGIGETSEWGQGLGKDMRWAQICFAFERMALNRIYATVWTENIAMCKVNEKCGLKLEGVMRQDILSHGEFRDRSVYAILQTEYQKIVKDGHE